MRRPGTGRLFWLLALSVYAAAGVVNYDIVYVRAPRAGDNTYVRFPDVFFPTAMPSGSDLILLHPNGTEEVLFAAGNGAVLDPAVSLDGQWVFFSYIPDASNSGVNPQRGLAYGGADIYKINMSTRQVVRLTHQEWAPPTGSANWSTDPLTDNPPGSVFLGYGIFNLGSCPLPNGKLMFVSSRDGYLPNKGYTTPNLRLYIMDDDGRNVEPVGHLNIGSALHPTVLMDGRVMFASFESQGVRDQRNWGLWAIWPDGRVWEPLMSAFTEGGAFHFQAQLSDGRIAVTDYYNLNDNGFGTILGLNPRPQAGTVPFGSPDASDSSNPAVRWGLWDPGVPTAFQPRYTGFSFSPQGLVNLTAFSHGEDRASSVAQDGGYAGKATQPAGAPNGGMLLVWTPGPANNLNRPTPTPYYDAGIYLLPGGQPVDDYRNLVKIKNDPNYNELQPKAVVPYSSIYGIAQPVALPYLPNDGSLSALLPPGTPFGLIGTSSFYNRNTTPGFGSSAYNGLDSFNSAQNGESSNWFEQGADAGKYTNADIFAVRILAMEGVAHRSYPSGDDPGFINFSEKERLRILGEIPLRKTDAGGNTVLDPQGNPDTSFLAKVPADTPISFQTLDKSGMVLNMAQTWHMVRPGEVRNNCGGCHAHNKLPLDFASSAAAFASYQPADLTTQTPLLTKDSSGNTIVKQAGRLVVDVEYYKDIKPILQRSCVMCHSKSGTAAAGLVLDDTSMINGYENTYNRLANDSGAQWGILPVIASKQWRQTNASRYIREFQSRRSLLVWKVFGQRLDGWANGDHPTESTPGNPSTLPAGADPNLADIDYTGTIMPPPNSGVAPLSDDEKMTIARWIDLGAPITAQDPNYKGYFADEIKPTLTLSSPRSGSNAGPLTFIRIGMFDAYSGINASSLSVTTNFAVNGSLAGAELASGFSQTNASVWTLALSSPVTNLLNGHIVVHVKDNAGNITTIDRWFSVGAAALPPTAPVLTSPVNGATGISVRPSLTWNASSAAASYDVYLGPANPPPLVSNTTGTSFAPTTLAASTQYFWEVVARNSSGAGASAIWSFSTLTMPNVTNVTSLNANGTYGVGAMVSIQVSFSGAVNVTGTPQLVLNSGGTASYSSGSGTTTLTFTYTVAAGQTSAKLDYTFPGALMLNGGTIKDTGGTPVNLALPTPGAAGSLGANKNIVISAPPNRPSLVGVFRSGQWHQDLSGTANWSAATDFVGSFGLPGDIPVVGDWDGSGTTKMGVFRAGIWFLDINGNGQWDGPLVDRTGSFGVPGDTPVVGDWTGDGKTKIGIFRNGQWHLDTSGTANWSVATDRSGGFGIPGDIPVVGDWTGDGKTKVGVFRNGQWHLDTSGAANWSLATDRTGGFGLPGDIPVVGGWTGDGKTKVGIYRGGVWHLDTSGTANWSSNTDLSGSFGGQSGDIPVVGRWTH